MLRAVFILLLLGAVGETREARRCAVLLRPLILLVILEDAGPFCRKRCSRIVHGLS